MVNLSELFKASACAVVVFALGCGDDEADSMPSMDANMPSMDAGADAEAGVDDAGSPWQACNGSRGMALSCESYGARTLEATRFDPERGCFEDVTTLENVCGVPVYCPGGSGTLVCVVEDGDAYATIVLWGEELSSGSHHSDGPDLGSTLTDSEAALCREMFGDNLDAGAEEAAISLGNVVTGVYEMRPVCSAR